LRAAHGKIKLPDAYADLIGMRSVPAARGQAKNDESGDKRDTDKHPVLEVVTQNGKVLDQKVQRARAPICRAQ
jgi:hypothetical protein